MSVNGARILIQFFSSQLDDVDRRARILCHASQTPHVSRVWTLRNHEKGKL